MNRIYIKEYDPATNADGALLFSDYHVGAVYDETINGIYLTKSPLQTDPALKDVEKLEYPEEDGYRLTVNDHKKSYTYSFTLTCLLGKFYDMNKVNDIILTLQRSMQGKCVAVYNKYRMQKIVGYVLKEFKISDVQKVNIASNYRDLVDFEIEIEVNNPALCDLKGTTIPICNDSLS